MKLISQQYMPGTVQPQSFVINGLPSGPLTVAATSNPNSSKQLIFDLTPGTVPDGQYTITVAAVGPTGESSRPSAPFQLTVGHVPDVPAPALQQNLFTI